MISLPVMKTASLLTLLLLGAMVAAPAAYGYHYIKTAPGSVHASSNARALLEDAGSEFTRLEPVIQTNVLKSQPIETANGKGSLSNFEIDFTKPENPLGSPRFKGLGLEGSFYYLKSPQGSDISELNIDKFQMIEILKPIIKGDWSNKSFSKFKKAKHTIYALNFILPMVGMKSIPVLFKTVDKNKIKRGYRNRTWILVYRGNVVAPKTGTFRFIGTGIEFLGVRFNKKLVLEVGTFIPSLYSKKNPNRCIIFDGYLRKENLQYFLKKRKGYDLIKAPYGYDDSLGGLVAGKEFQVEKGKVYPIEIMLASIDSSENKMMLLIDETTSGKTEKEKYHLFTTTPYLPVRELREKGGYYGLDATSRYDEQSLVWYVEGQEKSADGTPLPIVTIKKELEKEWQKGVPKATVELRFAAEKNLYEKYQKLINDGADVNYEFSDGRYILMNEMGIISEGIDILLDNGADINLVWEEYCDFQATHRVRAMHDANLYFDGIDEKKLNYADDFMCYLHQKGVRFKPSKSGNLPIHYAALNGWPKYAKLAATSSNITYRNADGTTPIDIVTQCLDEMLKTKKELSSTLSQYIGAPPIYNSEREKKLRKILEIFNQKCLP